MRALNSDEVNDLLGSLAQPGALTELAVLAGCLTLAWCIVRLIRGPTVPEASIVFGRPKPARTPPGGTTARLSRSRTGQQGCQSNGRRRQIRPSIVLMICT